MNVGRLLYGLRTWGQNRVFEYAAVATLVVLVIGIIKIFFDIYDKLRRD